MNSVFVNPGIYSCAFDAFWEISIHLFCSSFAARDCNACFSQIFEKRTLAYLNEEEESHFMTLRTFDSSVSHARIL